MGEISLASNATYVTHTHTYTLIPGVAPFVTWNAAFAQAFHPVTASLPQSQRINALHMGRGGQNAEWESDESVEERERRRGGREDKDD